MYEDQGADKWVSIDKKHYEELIAITHKVPPKTTTISLSHYNQLVNQGQWLETLYAAGVEYWDGMPAALDIWEEVLKAREENGGE